MNEEEKLRERAKDRDVRMELRHAERIRRLNIRDHGETCPFCGSKFISKKKKAELEAEERAIEVGVPKDVKFK